MVNTDQALESQWVTPELVKNSVTKRGVVLTEGSYETGKFGPQLTLLLDMDGKQRKYSPNKDTIRNLRAAYGVDTKSWISQVIAFQISFRNGKEIVVGSSGLPPMTAQHVQMTQNGRVV